MTNHEEFVRAYMQAYKEGLNAKWVAEMLGIGVQRVYQLRQYLKNNLDVELPTLARRQAMVEAAKLRKIVKEEQENTDGPVS